jgi:hypothetical protein
MSIRWLPCALLGFPLQAFLAFKNGVTPATLRVFTFLANASIKHLHPTFFVCSGVGIEIDNLAIVESNSETFFDKHVAFFLFCKAGFSTLAPFTSRFLLSEGTSVIDQLTGICEIDGGAWLTSGFMVSGEFATNKLEVSTTPVLS